MTQPLADVDIPGFAREEDDGAPPSGRKLSDGVQTSHGGCSICDAPAVPDGSHGGCSICGMTALFTLATSRLRLEFPAPVPVPVELDVTVTVTSASGTRSFPLDETAILSLLTFSRVEWDLPSKKGTPTKVILALTARSKDGATSSGTKVATLV